MGKLVYLMNVSLDGYVETRDRGLEWSLVDEEVHTWFNDQTRSTDAFLYGRRINDLMAGYWPTSDTDPNATPAMLEFGRLWNATPRVVFSRTLDGVDPAARLATGTVEEELARVRAEFPGEISVAGPTLAAAFIERGLVDAYRLVVHPVVLGGGTPYFPRLERPIGLRLVETRTFTSGVVYLGYETTASSPSPGPSGSPERSTERTSG